MFKLKLIKSTFCNNVHVYVLVEKFDFIIE